MLAHCQVIADGLSRTGDSFLSKNGHVANLPEKDSKIIFVSVTYYVHNSTTTASRTQNWANFLLQPPFRLQKHSVIENLVFCSSHVTDFVF